MDPLFICNKATPEKDKVLELYIGCKDKKLLQAINEQLKQLEKEEF